MAIWCSHSKNSVYIKDLQKIDCIMHLQNKQLQLDAFYYQSFEYSTSLLFWMGAKGRNE